MKLKTAKDYEIFKGFTLKEKMVYGTVNGKGIVISSVPYAYTESTEEIHLWILEDGKWTLQYIDGYILEDCALDLDGFKVDLVDFVKAMQWTMEPTELEYIYFKSNITEVVITHYRNMYGLWTIEEIFEM